MHTIENPNVFSAVEPAEQTRVEGGMCGPIMLDLRSVADWVASWVDHATSCYRNLRSM
jgi:hypothetical protein